jgi:hypothetical protein
MKSSYSTHQGIVKRDLLVLKSYTSFADLKIYTPDISGQIDSILIWETIY